MQGDVQLNPRQAEVIQWRKTNSNLLVMWVVTWNTADYPRQAAARPRLIGAGTETAVNAVLLADSLDELRHQLPDGLNKLERHQDDDPVVIEVWV